MWPAAVLSGHQSAALVIPCFVTRCGPEACSTSAAAETGYLTGSCCIIERRHVTLAYTSSASISQTAFHYSFTCGRAAKQSLCLDTHPASHQLQTSSRHNPDLLHQSLIDSYPLPWAAASTRTVEATKASTDAEQLSIDPLWSMSRREQLQQQFCLCSANSLLVGHYPDAAV